MKKNTDGPKELNELTTHGVLSINNCSFHFIISSFLIAFPYLSHFSFKCFQSSFVLTSLAIYCFQLSK